MAFQPGDMVVLRWPTPLDPNCTLTARLLGEVPETRYVGRYGEEYTVGRGWSARIIAPDNKGMDQWLVAHVDEMCIAPKP